MFLDTFFWKKMIPSGYVKHSYWKWPSRNSGVFPLKNGGSFHSFLIFLLTFTRGSSPTLCIGFWRYLSWRCLPNSSHICTLTKTGFIHVPSRQGRGFTDPWYFVGKSHGKCPSHLTRQHFFSSGIQKWRVLLSIIIPSGKRSHNYGKIHHFSMGKLHYFYGHFQ